MDKKTGALIAVIILLLIGLSFAKTQEPKEVDWSHNFINTKTSPYGTYITYQLLEDVFDKAKIRSTRLPVYNNLKKGMQEYFYYNDEYTLEKEEPYYYGNYTIIEDSLSYDGEDEYLAYEEDEDPLDRFVDIEDIRDTTSYVFIHTRFDLDKVDRKYLLDFVGIGNNVFVAAEMFDKKLLDTLGVTTESVYMDADSAFTLTDYPEKKYNFAYVYARVELKMDKCTQPYRILATNNKGEVVFAEIKFGKGNIYLHTMPTAFANINMLKTEKYDFGFRSLSYLPRNGKVLWDEYQTQGSPGEGGSFQEMLKSPPLRVALYLILGGLLLFMIFRAKRIQRIIPVIEPPVNSSLEFLDTISNLYYQKKDFKTIALKRHAYFLDFIRKHFYLSTESVDEDFLKSLSAKSGVEKSNLASLFGLYADILHYAYVDGELFLRYNNLLEEFYRNVKAPPPSLPQMGRSNAGAVKGMKN
ncbi:MAG: hypothetical protein E6767_02225 [Dysgonomonas sp.]|nr:hypothetical protein [Dysgonomonas sp.]